jgi:hypothetical protein
MLTSEIEKWHWVITWDNPRPADSSAMIAALSSLGKLMSVQTKTTYILAPKANVRLQQIRDAIRNNLDPRKGNAVYVNLRTRNAFECGTMTGFKWRRAN